MCCFSFLRHAWRSSQGDTLRAPRLAKSAGTGRVRNLSRSHCEFGNQSFELRSSFQLRPKFPIRRFLQVCGRHPEPARERTKPGPCGGPDSRERDATCVCDKKKNTPPENKVPGKMRLQSTKSGAGYPFLPLDCSANASRKGDFCSQTPAVPALADHSQVRGSAPRSPTQPRAAPPSEDGRLARPRVPTREFREPGF